MPANFVLIIVLNPFVRNNSSSTRLFWAIVCKTFMSFFESKDFALYFSNQDVYTKIDMLQKEKEFLVSIKRYRDAMFVQERINKYIKR